MPDAGDAEGVIQNGMTKRSQAMNKQIDNDQLYQVLGGKRTGVKRRGIISSETSQSRSDKGAAINQHRSERNSEKGTACARALSQEGG